MRKLPLFLMGLPSKFVKPTQLIVLFLLLTNISQGQSGVYDVNFNTNGSGTNAQVCNVLPIANDQLLLAGDFTTFNGVNIPDRLIRLNSDGTIDNTFNNGGTGANGIVNQVITLPNGQLLIIGFFNQYNGQMVSEGITLLNADGTIDNTFNTGGTGADNEVNSIVLQADGKVLIAGKFTMFNGTDTPDRIIRLNADGTIDSSFNAGGTGADNSVNKVQFLPDGKILIGGAFTTYNGVNASDGIIRLNANGTLDTSFNSGSTGTDNKEVRTIAVQTDGKILIGGTFTTYNGVDIPDFIARLNADGTLDTNFNAAGAGANSAVISALLVQEDGDIVIGGRFTTYNGTNIPNGLIRLNSDGSIESTFNVGGTGIDMEVKSITSLANGQLIIGGAFTMYNGADVPDGVIALLAAPKPEITLTNNGIDILDGTMVPSLSDATQFPTISSGQMAMETYLITNSGTQNLTIDGVSTNPTNTAINAFTISIDKMVLAPNETANLKLTFLPTTAMTFENTVTIRSNDTDEDPFTFTIRGTGAAITAGSDQAGIPDATFNANGTGTDNTVCAIEPDANGNILVGGNFTRYNGVDVSDRIISIKADGTIDNTFNTGGSGANGIVETIKIEPTTGKVLLGGFFSQYNGLDVPDGLIRLNSDGTIDNTFNAGGLGTDLTVRSVDFQSDGKLIITGNFTSYNGVNMPNHILRLNADGTIDNTFNTGGIGTNGVVNSVEVLADNSLIISGSFTQYNGVNVPNNVIKLAADGTLDVAFNNNGSAKWT